jgi:hypothetical protein
MVLHRTLHPETRVLDARKGIVEYVASDETLDQQGEVIRAKGWRFTHFPKNAPFVDSHDYGTIGKCIGKVIDFAVKGKRLIETVQWAVDVAENQLAQFGWKMTAAGFLKAVSVGFNPVRSLRPGDKGWSAELSDLGLSDSTEVRRIYVEQEQIELSAVILGVNPNALARAYKGGVIYSMSKAYKDGILDDAELDFASAGIAEQVRRAEQQSSLLAQLNTSASITSKASFLRAFERALRRT